MFNFLVRTQVKKSPIKKIKKLTALKKKKIVEKKPTVKFNNVISLKHFDKEDPPSFVGRLKGFLGKLHTGALIQKKYRKSPKKKK